MLTRLRVSGFKNLGEVDLRFGPFTCIAGRNGAGKSNVFDAITLLADLASHPLVAATMRVRGTEDRIAGIEAIFSKTGQSGIKRASFIAEMIVSPEVSDEYDRKAMAQATYLEYSLTLCYDPRLADKGKEPLYIDDEKLEAKPSSTAGRHLLFHPGKRWRQRYLSGPGQRKGAFIDTLKLPGGEVTIQLHGEGKGGRPSPFPARQAPQTVLSGINTNLYPTALAARREMQSWRLLQLEPTALRTPDQFRSPSHVSPTGLHLPNAVLRCDSGNQVAGLLAELLPGIQSVIVDVDKPRQANTLIVRLRDKQSYAASALSDGTLRFLALAVLASDDSERGLTCLEEPENGIHPTRIPQMIDLVRNLADVRHEEYEGMADEEMPDYIRQVIINTHSPLVVAELQSDEILMAETLHWKGGDWVNFRPLPGTWRAAGLESTRLVARGELAEYLGAQGSAGRNPDLAGRPTVSAYYEAWIQRPLELTEQI